MLSSGISPEFGVAEGSECLSADEVLGCVLTIQEGYQRGKLAQDGKMAEETLSSRFLFPYAKDISDKCSTRLEGSAYTVADLCNESVMSVLNAMRKGTGFFAKEDLKKCVQNPQEFVKRFKGYVKVAVGHQASEFKRGDAQARQTRSFEDAGNLPFHKGRGDGPAMEFSAVKGVSGTYGLVHKRDLPRLREKQWTELANALEPQSAGDPVNLLARIKRAVQDKANPLRLTRAEKMVLLASLKYPDLTNEEIAAKLSAKKEITRNGGEVTGNYITLNFHRAVLKVRKNWPQE